MQQEDLNKLKAAFKLTIHSVKCGTQSYTAEEFLVIQKVLNRSCLILKKRFAAASLDPVDSIPMEAIEFICKMLSQKLVVLVL